MRQTQRLDNTCSISLSLTFSIDATYRYVIQFFLTIHVQNNIDMKWITLLYYIYRKKTAYLLISRENIWVNEYKFNPHFLTTQYTNNKTSKERSKTHKSLSCRYNTCSFLLNFFLLSNHNRLQLQQQQQWNKIKERSKWFNESWIKKHKIYI